MLAWGQALDWEDVGELEEHPWGAGVDGTEAWTRDRLHSLSPAVWCPSVHWYRPWLSLMGSLLCPLTVFLLTWWAALIAMLLILLLLLYTFCKKPGKWAGR